MKHKEYRKVQVPSFEIEVPVYYEERKNGGVTRPVQMHGKGMMNLIMRSMPTSDARDMLSEYAKFYVLGLAGVESYPIVEKK